MFTEYSLLWLFPIVLLAAAASYFLYFYKPKADFTKKERYILSSLRFLGIFLIFFLLLSPIISYNRVTKEKPLVVIAQDNSQSLVLTKYASFYRNDYQKQLNALIAKLQENYDVKLVSFGSNSKEIETENAHFLFNDYATNISSTLAQINNSYQNSNLASVILASDGIVNNGESPLNGIDNFIYPIYTVAMGDTTQKKDLLLSDVRYNHTVYLNSEFPLHIVALAKKAQGASSICKVTQNGRTIFEKNFSITSNNYSQEFNTTLSAQKAGVEHWRISLQVVKGEQTIANNVRDIFVRVLDSKKKILLVAQVPDPDIAAIKQSIETNMNYSCKSVLYGNMGSASAQLKDCDALILHNIPANSSQLQFVTTARSMGKPILYILGDKTQLSYFNSLNTGLQVSAHRGSLVQATGVLNKTFSLFSLSEGIDNVLSQLPPLNVPYATYALSGTAQSLINQKVGSLLTSYPLVSFSVLSDGTHVGVISGEGIWRWRLQNFLINGTFAQCDELILKTMQYICSKDEGKNFRVICDNVFSSTQNVTMTAELYDQSHTLTNIPEVTLTIMDSKGRKTPYTFSKTMNAYSFDGGVFPQGEYSFVAQTTFNGKKLTDKGIFFVSSESLEGKDLVADHNLLYTLSSRTSGAMIYPSQLDSLPSLLAKNQNIKPMLHQSVESKKLLDSWWYLLLIIACFSAEWFLRKYWA